MMWQSNINIFKYLYFKGLKQLFKTIVLREKADITLNFCITYLFSIIFFNFIYVKLLFSYNTYL